MILEGGTKCENIRREAEWGGEVIPDGTDRRHYPVERVAIMYPTGRRDTTTRNE